MVSYLPLDPSTDPSTGLAPGLAAAAPPQVAFAVTRRVGSAVVRNRTRRRLRAAARIVTTERSLQGGALLIGANREAVELAFESLTAHLREAMARAMTPASDPAIDRSRHASA
jgi:ribonuclease P protein component